jgi:uncharacterized membrane protein YfcA
VSSVLVDAARLLVYGAGFYALRFSEVEGVAGLVVAATLAAFIGAFLGARLIKKVTLRTVQLVVGALLIVVGLGMTFGLL